MGDEFHYQEFVDDLRQNFNHYYEEWWPHFLTFSEHVDKHYIVAAPVLLIVFLGISSISSIISFILGCTFLLVSCIKIWKYWQVLEKKSRRKEITIQPIITTSGNYPTLQKRKYGNHLSSPEGSGMNQGDDASSSRMDDADDTSTIGAFQDGSRRNQRHPLSLREWSTVTSPGFTTRVVKQAGLHNGSTDGTNWNRSPFQYSPDKDLQVGEIAYGSRLRSGRPYKDANKPTMDIISWTRTRSLTPTTYISVKPREPEPEFDQFSNYVNSTPPKRSLNEMSPNRNGGLGGIPNSSVIGRSPNNSIFENSKSSPYNQASSLTPTPPPSSILEALANRKRIRDTESGVPPTSQSPSLNKRASIPSMYNEDVMKNSKRVKFLSHDPNTVLPYSMMPLPDLSVNEDEPMMATESILDQLNQTEKRYLPEDDTTSSFRPGAKKMKSNNVVGSKNLPGASPARKRKMLNPLGTLDDEVQEKTTRICNCTECYDELAGAKIDQYGNSLDTTPNGNDSSRREIQSKTIRKVVDQATETDPESPLITKLVEIAKPRVITKEQVKHDQNLRQKRLQIMLELSKEKKAKFQTPSTMASFPAEMLSSDKADTTPASTATISRGLSLFATEAKLQTPSTMAASPAEMPSSDQADTAPASTATTSGGLSLFATEAKLQTPSTMASSPAEMLSSDKADTAPASTATISGGPTPGQNQASSFGSSAPGQNSSFSFGSSIPGQNSMPVFGASPTPASTATISGGLSLFAPEAKLQTPSTMASSPAEMISSGKVDAAPASTAKIPGALSLFTTEAKLQTPSTMASSPAEMLTSDKANTAPASTATTSGGLTPGQNQASSFVSSAPGQNSTFSFGSSTGQNSMPVFGASSTPASTATISGDLTPGQNQASSFGSSAPGQNSTFSFGSSKPGQNSMPVFGATSTPASTATTSGGLTPGQNQASSFGSSAPSQNSTFTFGSSTPGQNSMPVFGSSSTPGSTATISGGLTPGQNQASSFVSSAPGENSTFSFGSSTGQNSMPVFGSSSTPASTATTPGGLTPGQNKASSFLSSAPGQNSTFTFGSSKLGQNSMPVFGSSSTPASTATISGGLTLGQNQASSFGSSAPGPGQNSTFSFGSSKPGQNSMPVFGATSTPASTATISGGLTLGQNQASSFGSSAPGPGQNSTFSFGSSKLGQNSMPVFGSSSTPASTATISGGQMPGQNQASSFVNSTPDQNSTFSFGSSTGQNSMPVFGAPPTPGSPAAAPRRRLTARGRKFR